jgi:hypothetical protein
MSSVWGRSADCDTNVVEVSMRRLRAKIDDPFNNKLIHTLRGVGYVLETRDQTALLITRILKLCEIIGNNFINRTHKCHSKITVLLDYENRLRGGEALCLADYVTSLSL